MHVRRLGYLRDKRRGIPNERQFSQTTFDIISPTRALRPNNNNNNNNMRRGQFPIESLPTWCLLNDVKFLDVKAQAIQGRGYGLVAEKELTNKNHDDNTAVQPLLKVPHDLILSSEGVEEHAKENKDFRLLLDTAGRQVSRSLTCLRGPSPLVVTRSSAGVGLTHSSSLRDTIFSYSS